jgi:hypothetical protein
VEVLILVMAGAMAAVVAAYRFTTPVVAAAVLEVTLVTAEQAVRLTETIVEVLALAEAAEGAVRHLTAYLLVAVVSAS